MEWRQQTSVSCADAFTEAQRWIEEVTGKSFGCRDFRAALENGVLLCDLINQLKPGIIKRVNRLSTPIAGLDNVNVFLKACGKLGLNVSQLFHPGDLQDLSTRATLRRDESNRRLKNVLVTIYWLGRRAHLDAFYRGPQLNFKAFEGLLGLALSKALDEGSNVFVKDSWYPEREECLQMRHSDKENSMGSQALRPKNEGCGSDAEAEQVFKMETIQPAVKQIKGYLSPPLLQRNQGLEENGKDCAIPLARGYQIEVRPEKVQVNPGWIWSKSLSDIPMVYPVRKIPDGKFRYCVGQEKTIAQEWNQENEHKWSIAAKNVEAQWQDDLSKWKNRRRSTKSEIYQKSQDREHVISRMINGASADFEKNETGRLLKRDQQSSHKHNPATHSPSFSPSKSSSSDLPPETRALLVRCFASETPFSPTAPSSCNNVAQTPGATAAAMPASDGNILAEETHVASFTPDKAVVTTPSLDFPFSFQTQVKVQRSPVPLQPNSELAQQENVYSRQISTLITTIQPNKTPKSASTRDPTPSMSGHKELQFDTDPEVPTFFSPDTVNVAAVDALESLEKNQRTYSEPAVDKGRGQQVATVYKSLSGTGSWSSSASLPRGYRRSEGSLRLSATITSRPFLTKQSRMSSVPRLCYVDDNQAYLLKSEKAEPFPPPIKSLLKRQTASAHLTGQSQPSIRPNPKLAQQNGTEQAEEAKEITPDASQTSFQTNGHHHMQAQRNKTTHLPSNTTTVRQKVDHRDMRVSFSLKPNSRPDFGFQTNWDSRGVRVKFIQPGSAAELCQLCVDDEIVAVNGAEVIHMNYKQWKDKMTYSLQTGSLTMDIRRYGNKDWSTSEGVHPNQPGQSKMTMNLTTAAPALIGHPDHRANGGISAETTVRRMSKFNGQTDNVLQGKVMHGEWRAENHRTARSKGGSESAISDLQVPRLSPSSSSWSWNQEEDRRRQEKWQEEQERLLQEQYQRDQERLKAEWQRAQQDAMGELYMEPGSTFQMMTGGESPVSNQPPVYGFTNKTRGEGQRRGGDEQKDGSRPQSNGQCAPRDKMTDFPARADNSCCFVQLSSAHRAKSLSTPALAGPHKQTRGDEGGKTRSLSKVELDRQQILDEMKKRTQLLTDNSWIRQRSSSSYKEPVYMGAPLRRFESLDNLESLRRSPRWSTTFSYPRPHSAAAGYCAPGRNSSSSRYSTGGILSHRNGTMDPSHHGSVSAANDWSPSSNPKQEAIL